METQVNDFYHKLTQERNGQYDDNDNDDEEIIKILRFLNRNF